ncbi:MULTISPECIES: carbohydrate ABC transporter permease [Blautia]|uniref:carbohydrate ABC transporter permease n=1 Tax=Blautia TaxID=572511 RepID=UPI000BA4B22A|nr:MULTISPECIES: carbohydrate ABC transporter permease [Blautia]
MRKKVKKTGEILGHYLSLMIISAFVLLPYYWMVVTAVKPTEEVMVSPATLLPSRISLDNFSRVWQSIPLGTYMKNSLVVSVAVTAVSVVFATLCGYSISRYIRRRAQKVSLVLMLCTQLIPGIVTMISLYFIMFNMGMTNTYRGLIIAYTVWAVPFCTLMIKGYFDAAIPREIEESARVDGCSQFGTFFRICLPISVPGIISTAIFAFILAWNEYMWASILLSGNKLKPVSVGVYDFIGQYGANTKLALTMTAGIFITLPAVIIFAFLQKYLISGLAAGAVKG